MVHFTQLPQEIYLSIIRLLINDKELSLSSILGLKRVHSTISDTFIDNQNVIYRGLAKKHLAAEALDFLEMMRPGGLSPCQKNYVVHVIESEIATRLSLLDPSSAKYIGLSAEFQAWKKASYCEWLDERPGWTGWKELCYLNLCRSLFIDDYVTLVRLVVIPNLSPREDLSSEERERIESSLWLLHVLLGHYHRVPLVLDRETSDKDDEASVTGLDEEEKAKVEKPQLGVAVDGFGVNASDLPAVPKVSFVDAFNGADPNNPSIEPSRLIPQNPMLISRTRYKPNRDMDTMHPVVRDDTPNDPQTAASEFSMVFDLTYIHTIPLRKHLHLAATISLFESFNALYSWLRNNLTPCKLEHYVHGSLWDRFIDPAKAWPYPPAPVTEDSATSSSTPIQPASEQYYTPQERSANNAAFMARVQNVLLQDGIWDSGQANLTEFIDFLDSHPNWRFNTGWRTTQAMHITNCYIWSPETRWLDKRDIWVPDAEQFWGVNSTIWPAWQCQMQLIPEQSPGISMYRRLRGAEQVGVDVLSQMFAQLVAANVDILAEMSSAMSNPEMLAELANAFMLGLAQGAEQLGLSPGLSPGPDGEQGVEGVAEGARERVLEENGIEEGGVDRIIEGLAERLGHEKVE
ncbi:hypothetical protein BJ508DRAFT_46527 [Ascobolus immersus RN42]|uniref:Uncharacterized protein n=1 Tax=Ascobolus immersus RN42 TaxID=1160509 RepID=A0A3N4ICZ3_ASCIM|nr:hypothetical protein BJ508DRAFT_46527 [Ascobolus immersus RN42]